MPKKRKIFTEKFKAKVALEAIRGVRTANEIASEHQIHPNQVSQWKAQLVSNASDLFSRGKGSNLPSAQELTGPLYEEIGRLKMDIKWLEKKL